MEEINAQTVNRLLFKMSTKSVGGVEVAAAAHCSITQIKRLMQLLDVIRSHSIKDVFAALAPDMDFSKCSDGVGGEKYFDDVENAIIMLIRLLDSIDNPLMLTEVDEKEWNDKGFIGGDNLSPKALRLCDSEPL